MCKCFQCFPVQLSSYGCQKVVSYVYYSQELGHVRGSRIRRVPTKIHTIIAYITATTNQPTLMTLIPRITHITNLLESHVFSQFDIILLESLYICPFPAPCPRHLTALKKRTKTLVMANIRIRTCASR
jgi:hypothetical protein